MSGSLNKVILIGNLGDGVKMHYFDEANCIGRFPIATNESYTLRETGERVTQTEWHRIVTRNKLAQLCEKYLTKGDSVYVEGKIKTRKWSDNGVDRYQTEIQAESIQFLNTKGGVGTQPNPIAPQKPNTQPKVEEKNNSEDELDDLPF